MGPGTPVVSKEYLGDTMLGATYSALRRTGRKLQEESGLSEDSLLCLRYAAKLGCDDMDFFVELAEMEALHGYKDESAAAAERANLILDAIPHEPGETPSEFELDLRARLLKLC